MMPPVAPTSTSSRFKAFLIAVAVVAILLAIAFLRTFHPDYVVFSNDGPFGAMAATSCRLPATLTGVWTDLNWFGGPYPAPAPDVSTALRLLTSPLVCSKIYPAFSLLVLGLCAWMCFRLHRFAPLVCLLAAVAAALNSDFFATACWGVCSQPIAFGMNFLAIGALADTTSPRRWVRLILAGFAVGMGVMQAYDIGALFSLFVGAYVVVQALVESPHPESERRSPDRLAALEGHRPKAGGDAGAPWLRRLCNGVLRLAVVGLCAGLISAAALMTLVGTQIKGVVGTEQDAESKAARWSFATQYSIPKLEALGMLVPGLFGLRHDTPEGGAYWGRGGSDSSWDEVVASDGQRGQPHGAFRAGAGSTYAGVLVVLLAIYGLAQSFRKQGGPLSATERKLVWFWGAALVVALLLMFGRFAPFYQFFYALPYVSTIRNPAKFHHLAQWALVFAFAYGAEALWRSGFTGAGSAASGLVAHWQSWWSRVRGFDRRWVIGSALGLGVFVLVWLIYASSRDKLANYIAGLTHLQYAAMGQKPNAETAEAILESAKASAAFSIEQVGRTLLYLLPAIGLVVLAVSGYFRGAKAKLGGALLIGLLIADLLPADRPWVVFVNWKVKYETNPVIEFLRQRSYEQRVAIFPLDRFVDVRRLPREMMPVMQQYSFFAQLYGIEWTQHLFQLNNIQTLDIVQEPRVAQDKAAYEAVLAFAPPLRRYELSNTRYLLGPAAFLDSLNQQLDAGKARFRLATRFDLAAKPNVDPSLPQSEQVTTVLSTNGQLAVLDFAGALPRAKLYTNWKVSTNEPSLLREWVKSIQPSVPPEWGQALAAQSDTDLATLRELTSPAFDPTQTVLLAEPLPVSPGTNQVAGEVKFESYAPKHLVFTAKAAAPSVLLLNDKFDPNWKVTVDGKPAKLLRADFIVRGVFLEAGEHRVEFKFQPSLAGLYISLVSVAVALGLLGYAAVAGRKQVEG
jgi:hypothetical protein